MSDSALVLLSARLTDCALPLTSALSYLSCRFSFSDDIFAFKPCPALILLTVDEVQSAKLSPCGKHSLLVAVGLNGNEDAEEKALFLGADAYLPLSSPKLILARLRVLIGLERRAEKEHGVFLSGLLRIDFSARAAFWDGKVISLTPTEYTLLAFLAAHAGKTVSYDVLCRESGTALAALRVHMTALRKKLQKISGGYDWIRTRVGVGYLLGRTPLEGGKSKRS